MPVTKQHLVNEIQKLKEELLLKQKKVRRSDNRHEKMGDLIAACNRTLQKIYSSTKKDHVSTYCCLFRQIRKEADVLIIDF